MRKTFLFLGAVFLSACSNPPKPMENKTLDIEGHRGCRGIFPENSVEGFMQALSIGVNTLEMDVVITADSQVIVSHEPWMSWEIATGPDGKSPDSTNEKAFNIFKMRYDEVKQWDCGSKIHPRFPIQQKMKTYKPLLSEVFEQVEKYIAEKKIPPVQYNIEIKSTPQEDNIFHPSPTVFCQLVTQVIEKYALEKRVIIQSFDVRSLQVMHANHPKYRLSLLVDDLENPKAKLTQCGFKIEVLSPNYKMVDAELVDYCRSKKMQLIPWTVNDEEDMKRMIALGVDGFISDFPDLAITLR
jgi:glycerophosphoryl diester phosphodiesterase